MSDLKVAAREVRAMLTDPGALVSALSLDQGMVRKHRWMLIRCPVHNERNASMSVRIGKDGTIAVNCFSCGWRGDALALIAAVEGHDLKRADGFRAVIERAGEIAQHHVLLDVEEPKLETVLSDATYSAIGEFLLERCSLKNAPRVAAYLEARGIYADAEAAGVRGYPDDARGLVRDLLATFERDDLERAGVVRRGQDALDWAQSGVLVPWRDRYGTLHCIQRRCLDGDARNKYRCPPSRAPRAPFGSDVLVQALGYAGPSADVIIVEGALDCLARRRMARECGEVAAVIAIDSASSGMALPIDLMQGRRIVLALDDDDAGNAAAEKIRDSLPNDAEVIRERPIGAKDWAELAARRAWKVAS